MKKSIFSLILALLFLGGCNEKSPTDIAQEVFLSADEVILLIAGDNPEWAKEALRCHGKEEECANDYMARTPDHMKSTSKTREQYIEGIKANYLDYPPPLRKEVLHPVLSDVIQSEITPELKPIIVESGAEVQKYINNRKNLIVIAQLSVRRDDIPHIAVLNLSFYRPGISEEALFASISYSRTTIIPLNLNETQILDRIKNSAQGIDLYFTKKSH